MEGGRHGNRAEGGGERGRGSDPSRLTPHDKGVTDKLMLSGKNVKNQDAGTFETLLCRLQLEDKYQQKWTREDFMKILPPVSQSQETCEKDVAHAFLQRLLLLDYRARYIPVRQDSAEGTQTDSVLEPDEDETQDDLDLFFNTEEELNESKRSGIHPMDVQMAVFHCSDNFLKQTMITKLSQCQFALPLLVPDPVTMDIECPLWTFRPIKKTWKTTQTRDNSSVITMKSMSICQAETPLVSVFRLGSLPLSKSQLMNTLINNRHSTFFHRECPGSTKSRHLMEGVAEIAWYCPAGKPNDAFSDCTAFCNLHGDAMLYKQQREILTAKSSVIVVFVPTLKKGNTISELLNSEKPVIFLIADETCDVKKIQGKYKMGLKGKNQAAISEELQRTICSILSKPRYLFKLETMADVPGITVDEEEEICQKTKSAAMEIQQSLQGMDVAKIKDDFLSCQGELWHKWCSTNKELYNLRGSQIEMERSEKQEKMDKIREDQCIASGSKLMIKFIKSLSLFKSKDKEYFLKWTQILIDALPKNDLTPILKLYDDKWTEILTLKEKKQNTHVKQKELDELSKQLQSATFGLEHIFREMGQIYEAHASLESPLRTPVRNWSQYPELAAELLISGHPMELMDGDAGHVPLTWISSLLEEVVKKLGDRRIFVLSVLGVQSSGKSTMLNAMFGLEFAVSSGRCTKGAFMQLLKVSEEKRHFKFDYVLVVDTEGLRALELAGSATLKHDNELATFVVGLGDLTLINIFGENPADMQDVLQIVVQAFMRMKKVNLSPSCVFVHQNVTDISAVEKNMDGKRRLLEKLDQMVQLAAKEEVCSAERFSDIIAFNVQEDVKYFAQLWEGSPPMAPPNPGYSESIQELKNFILSKASQSDGTKLSDFRRKVQDLWQALLNENFVFSFKNTLEIAVYRKLEVKYADLTWTLRNNMLTIENQYYYEIKNGTLKSVQLKDLYEKTKETFAKAQTDLTSYFEDNTDKEILAQWQGRFKSKIKDVYDDQVKVVKNRLDKVIQQKEACKKLDDKKADFEDKLMQKSRELAKQLKGKTDDERELQGQFNSEWRHWVKELTRGTKPIDEISLENDKTEILLELGIEWSFIEESNRRYNFKKMPAIGNYDQYASIKKQDRNVLQRGADHVRNLFTSSLSHQDQELIRSFINEVEQKSLITLKSKPVAITGYNPTYLQELAKNAKDAVAEFESKQKYALKKEFTVDLLHYVFARAEPWLLNEHKTFKANNDAQAYIDGKKAHYYNIFKMCCKDSSSAIVFAAEICDKLKTSMSEAVCNNTARALASEIKNSSPAFSGNREDLENHVLKSLAENENFDSFITYIKQPRKHVENFIKERVQKYIFQENTAIASEILEQNVDDLKDSVNQALFGATKRVKTQRGKIDMWLEEFTNLLKDKLVFTMSSQNFSDINVFDFLKEEISKGIESITQELHSLPLDKIMNSRMKPDEILIDQLCSCCWVTCPFCSAICTNTLEDHSPEDHRVPFHRSTAVRGMYYHKTDEMAIEFCTSDVASDRTFRSKDLDKFIPYKSYRTAGPTYANWSITPDNSMLPYWKWFVCQFDKDLEKHYGYKFKGHGEIPSEWRKYTKEQAIKSLW
ncbi:interferon-induced very large GTPase 1-like [Nelusetta ayraudi]|uniref:interferon-induced very large GTPase 1-like n=1 Tax=Nelusetta ayraudi TaxID=303726 RepID=UPI003F713ED9